MHNKLKYLLDITSVSLLHEAIQHIHNLFKEIICKHNWVYWHTRYRIVDKKSHISYLDGKINYNQIRECSKCNKQQTLKLGFRNPGWYTSYRELDINKPIIDMYLKVAGSETKSEKRDRLINKILNENT